MKKKIRYFGAILLFGSILLNAMWSLSRQGNLMIYVQNEFDPIGSESYDVQVFVDSEICISDSIYFDQAAPLAFGKWIGPGWHTLGIESKRLNLASTETFFLFSTTWLVIDINEHGAAVKVHRMPIHLQ